MSCVICNNPRIVNKTKKLCDDCNYKRLHKGLSRFDVSKIKSNEQINKKRNTIRKKKKPSQIKSDKLEKRLEKKLEYKKICDKIDIALEPICTGCGRYQGGEIRLSHSHIISRDDCSEINRKDLVADEHNITFHCLDFGEHTGCHRKWESKNILIMSKLLDYEKNMNYIKSIDLDLYKKLINR